MTDDYKTKRFRDGGIVSLDDRHVYRLSGLGNRPARVIPGVTTLLKPLMPDYTFADTSTGTRIHALLEGYDLSPHGLTDEILAASEEDMRYVEAWRAFLATTGFQPNLIEELVFNPLLMYAGTVDRVGRVAYGQPNDVVLDIKTGDPHPWHGVQLAAYAQALQAEWGPNVARHRWGVYLKDTGQWEAITYNQDTDVTALGACISYARAAATIDVWRGANWRV